MKRDSAIPTPSRGLWRSLICERCSRAVSAAAVPQKNGMSADNVIYLRSCALDLRRAPRTGHRGYTVACVFALFSGILRRASPATAAASPAERSPPSCVRTFNVRAHRVICASLCSACWAARGRALSTILPLYGFVRRIAINPRTRDIPRRGAAILSRRNGAPVYCRRFHARGGFIGRSRRAQLLGSGQLTRFG